MTRTKSLPMLQLDLSKLSELITQLPDDYEQRMTPIASMVGKAWEIRSFSVIDDIHRVSIDNGTGVWMGKCTGPGWVKCRTSPLGKTPCVHMVGALMIDDRFDLVEYSKAQHQEDAKPIEPPAQEVLPPEQPTPKHEHEADAQEEAGHVASQMAAGELPNPNSRARDDDPLVRPVATLEDAAAVFAAFQAAKLSLLTKSDVQAAGDSNFLKKDAWRKLALYFGISCEKRSEGPVEGEDDRAWSVTMRATARNGTYHDATGFASWAEDFAIGRVAAAEYKAGERVKNGDWDQARADRSIRGAKAKMEHDVRTTAETRAKSRAISDLLGGGKVSHSERSEMKS